MYVYVLAELYNHTYMSYRMLIEPYLLSYTWLIYHIYICCSARLEVYDITVVEGLEGRKANVLSLAQASASEFHVLLRRLSPGEIPRDEAKALRR